jgi:hypothetical protein
MSTLAFFEDSFVPCARWQNQILPNPKRGIGGIASTLKVNINFLLNHRFIIEETSKNSK